MEAVAADLILLVVLVGQGVGIGYRRHGLVEGGVKHGHLGHVGTHDGLAGLDAGDVSGVVEGGQGDALLQSGHHLVVNLYRAGEGLAAVHHPVAHRIDLLHGGDHAVVRIHQSVHHRLDGLGMGGHGHVHRVDGVLAGGLVGELAVDADALAQALGQHLLVVGVQQLVLQGRAAGVDDENFHV